MVNKMMCVDTVHMTPIQKQEKTTIEQWAFKENPKRKYFNEKATRTII